MNSSGDEPRPVGRRRWMIPAAITAVLVAGASVQIAQASKPATVSKVPGTTPVPQVRDPLAAPFAWNSIWNLPVGSGAAYVPAQLGTGAPLGIEVDEDILLLGQAEGIAPVVENTAGWDATKQRCSSITQPSKTLFDAPIPRGFRTDPGYRGLTPNASAALLLGDGVTVRQTQPFHVCPDGRATSQFVFTSENIRTGSGQYGSHGGSGLSALGGTIRVGELRPGAVIRHALKLELDGATRLAVKQDDTPGFRWPADRADSYARTGYKGPQPELEMGALLALPPSFDISRLTSEPARILATTLRDYGAYVVDDTAAPVAAFATEWGPAGRVMDEFKSVFGHDFTAGPNCSGTSPGCVWANDLRRLLAELHVVANNAPDAIGGPGARRAPCAAPFPDGTGRAPASCASVGFSTPKPLKIMALGDSLTEGGGVGSFVSYRPTLRSLLTRNGYAVDFVGSQNDPTFPEDPEHEGHGGFTIGPDDAQFCVTDAAGVPSCSPEKFNLADNLDGWMAAAKPDVVLLLIGVNDMIPQTIPAGTSGLRRPVRPGDAPAKLVALIQRIRTLQPGVRLVVASLVPTELDRRWPDAIRVRRTLKDLAAADKSGKTGYADLAQVSLGAGDYADPIHLTASGADKVAQVWFEAMRTVLDTAGQTTAPASSNTTPSAQQTSPKTTSKPKATAKPKSTGSASARARTSTTLKRG